MLTLPSIWRSVPTEDGIEKKGLQLVAQDYVTVQLGPSIMISKVEATHGIRQALTKVVVQYMKGSDRACAPTT